MKIHDKQDAQKYGEVAALIRSWLNDPSDGDWKLGKRIEPYLQRLDNIKRGRFIVCRGCPTVECTCFTELEADLLEKIK